MTNNWFQDFFDTKPALAGIILALIISGLIFIIFGFYYLFRRNKIKAKKAREAKNKSLNINNDKDKKDKNNNESVISYFRLNIDKNGKLVIKNDKESDESYKLVESKDRLLQIINSKKEDLILPNGKITIMMSPDYNKENKDKSSRKSQFVTSSELFDNNLYVYKLFERYMDDFTYTWLRSKFS